MKINNFPAIVLAGFFCFACILAEAQVIDPKEAVKEQGTNRVNNKIEEGIDAGFNKIEEGIGSLFSKKKRTGQKSLKLIQRIRMTPEQKRLEAAVSNLQMHWQQSSNWLVLRSMISFREIKSSISMISHRMLLVIFRLFGRQTEAVK